MWFSPDHGDLPPSSPKVFIQRVLIVLGLPYRFPPPTLPHRPLCPKTLFYSLAMLTAVTSLQYFLRLLRPLLSSLTDEGILFISWSVSTSFLLFMFPPSSRLLPGSFDSTSAKSAVQVVILAPLTHFLLRPAFPNSLCISGPLEADSFLVLRSFPRATFLRPGLTLPVSDCLVSSTAIWCFVFRPAGPVIGPGTPLFTERVLPLFGDYVLI